MSDEEKTLAIAQYDTLQSELQSLSETLRERESDYRVVEIEQQKWLEQLPLIASRAKMRKKLLKNSHVSKDDWQAFEQNRIEAEFSTVLADEKKQSLQAAIDAISARKHQLTRERIESWELQMREQTETVTQVEKELLKANTQSDAHNIRAPVTGHVQELSVNTQGAVLTTAEPLLKVVPDAASLEVEAMVANKDIGFINEGQQAKVKIDAFPFTRFGAIEGTIDSISSDAIEDKDRGWVYRTSVSINKDTLNIEGKDVRISPGMSVSVEVKTGKRQLMEFIMAPLLRYKDESVRER